MVEQDIRWLQRFHNYQSALGYLRADLLEAKNWQADLVKRAIIKDFEIVHELAWKLMQDILKSFGVTDIFGSKDTTRLAFNRGLIQNGEIWYEMIRSRNLTVHTYDNSILSTEFQKIENLYLPLFIQFEQRVENLCQNLD
ncbi:HI0074 family nucleotidyltransferase substrate-binding subunit [Lonepinella sp. BR2357]|uniref:HI0074 family nucleotidyltransferase substrate-binding subunit n=1 Tax=Lonepinella sp. BR2357 TaxID=3434549 RepID=UPI003F6E35BE